ncbi:uncharacterized protein [Hetaerina americana]|uniref:uncharacterized protein n=1 Tax=Hetaerina americana TaxID=62018 RepID=UPI003A7F4FA4
MESVEEMIVAEIRDNYSFLYNVRDRKYRNREERDKAWAEIAGIVELDAKSCKTRWRSIRDRYLKERRRQSSNSPERKKWRLVPMLTFLDDTLEGKTPRRGVNRLREEEVPSTRNLASGNLLSRCDNENVQAGRLKIRRTPSVLKKKVDLSPSTRRIILPAMSLPPPPTRPTTTSVFPVSILKAASTSECSPCHQPATTTTSGAHFQSQPAITSTTSLLLLPSPATSSTTFDPTTTAETTSHGGGAESQRKDADPLGKLPLNPPQSLDEEDYYGLSVAGRLKKLSQRERALVHIEIEKLFLKHET